MGAAGHPGSCRGCYFDEHCLGQGSSRRECKQWFWSVVRRSGQQDSSGRFGKVQAHVRCEERQQRPSFIATKTGGTEAPRWYTSLKTKSS